MQSQVARELWMERRHRHASLAAHDRPLVMGRATCAVPTEPAEACPTLAIGPGTEKPAPRRCEHLDLGACFLDDRRSYENGVHRTSRDTAHLQVRLEGLDLAAERVAPDTTGRSPQSTTDRCGRRAHVEARRIIPAQVPSAGSPSSSQRCQLGREPRRLEQQRHGGRLASRQHESTDSFEVCRRPHRDGDRAAGPESRNVLTNVTLKSEHAHPRAASSPVVRAAGLTPATRITNRGRRA